MIKGVNKRIIEIRNRDSRYFEKAVLYLKPDVTFLPEELETDELPYFDLINNNSKRRGINRIMHILGWLLLSSKSCNEFYRQK